MIRYKMLQGKCQLLIVVIVVGVWLLMSATYNILSMPVAFAEVKTVDVEGEYTIGDGPDESIKAAKLRAYQDALRLASEKAGVYVETYTQIVNQELTEDDVRALSSTVLEVDEPTYITNDMDGKGFLIRCKVHAKVNSVKIDESLKLRRENTREWLMLQQQNLELQDQISSLSTEIEKLKAQYPSASNRQEKESIEKKINRNATLTEAAEWVRKGDEHQRKKEYDGAIADYSIAIEMDSKNLGAYYGRIFSYSEEKKHEQALADLDAVLAIESKSAIAYALRGGIYGWLGKFDAAERDFNNALSLTSDSHLLSFCYLGRGNNYCLQGNFQKAISDFTKALSFDDKYLNAYVYRGLAYYELGSLDTAIHDMEMVISINPEYQAEGLPKAVELLEALKHIR